MGIAHALGRTALNTVTGNQDFSASLGGLTPKAAVFRLVRVTAADTPGAPAYYVRGITDGVNSGCVDIGAEDAQTTSKGRTGIIAGAAATTDVVRTRRASNTSDVTNVDCALRFVSFAADKVTLNIRIAPPAGYLLEFWLLAGTDLTPLVDSFSVSLGAAGTSDRTGLGVPCDAALLFHDTTNGGVGIATACEMSEGYFAAPPHSSKAAQAVDFGAGDNPTVSRGDARDDCSKAVANAVSSGRLVVSQLPTGYRVTALDTAANLVLVLALNFNGKALAWAGNMPTATVLSPAQSFSTPRIRPDVALCTFSRRSTLNGQSTGGDSSCFGGGTMVGGTMFAAAVSSKHGVSPSIAKASCGSRFLHIPQEDGTLTAGGSPAAGDAVKATAAAIAQGLALTYSGASSTAREVSLLVIGPEFVLAPDPVLLPLNRPAPTVVLAFAQRPSPTPIPLVLPAPQVIAPRRPSAVVLPLVLPAPTIGQRVTAPQVIPPDLGPLYAEAMPALLPRGLAWQKRVTP